MYGLTQAGSMDNKLQQKRLAAYRFIFTPRTPGMWRHEKRTTQSALVLDDFGMEYEWKEAYSTS